MIFLDENKKVDFITDKWISLRTSGFVNPLVRRTSRFFDEIRALVTDYQIDHLGNPDRLPEFFLKLDPCQPQERGSSVGRMPDSQSREPVFESPLLPFRSLGIFFHFTTPQSTQLYK